MHRWILEARRRGFLSTAGKGTPGERFYRRASDGKWVGTLDLGRDAQGRRRRHVVYGHLRREVIAKLEEARNRLAADEPVKDAKTTVGAFIDEWTRKALPASTRRASTRQNYRTIARTHLVRSPFGAYLSTNCALPTSRRF